MDVPILVCECGMRVRAPGAKPGRVGRCPSCGGRLEVPERPVPSIEAAVEPDDVGFAPVHDLAMTPARVAPRKGGGKRRRPVAGPSLMTPMADGLLPVQQSPEKNGLVSFLFPLRGAECLGVMAGVGVIAWIFTVLVPEYCIQAMADSSAMGASLIGMLFVWIAALPIVFLGPLVLSYWLQYLGRVLVSGAMGECVPPRTPDRNFDGFLNGLSPWFVWVVLGLGVGFGPAAWFGFFAGGSIGMAIVLAAAGLPYVLAALMLSFLHDDALAAVPWGVLLVGLARLGLGFLLLCGLIAAAFGLVAGCLALTLWVRAHLFWPYLLVALNWWIIFLWAQIAVMRLLGVYYYHRKDSLKWTHAHPRWGVAWRL